MKAGDKITTKNGETFEIKKVYPESNTKLGKIPEHYLCEYYLFTVSGISLGKSQVFIYQQDIIKK